MHIETATSPARLGVSSGGRVRVKEALALAALAAVLAMLLAACGGGEEPTAPTAAGQPEASSTAEAMVEAAPTPEPTPTRAQSAADRAVLVALHHSTGGANWSRNSNWLSDRPIGEWQGVTTNSNSRVIKLRLTANNLTGTLPAELGGLSNLTELSLSSNRLTGEIPPELGRLSNLTKLGLGTNRLTGEIPPELGGLSNLAELSLSGNELTGEIPPELGGLSNLTELNLYGNELTGEIPPELGGLSNLTELNLYANQLSGAVPPELFLLPNLTTLLLGDNQLNATSRPTATPRPTTTHRRTATPTPTAIPRPTATLVVLGDCQDGMRLQPGEGCRYTGGGSPPANVVLSVQHDGAICREGGPAMQQVFGVTINVDHLRLCSSSGFERDDAFQSAIVVVANADESWTFYESAQSMGTGT